MSLEKKDSYREGMGEGVTKCASKNFQTAAKGTLSAPITLPLKLGRNDMTLHD